MDHSHPTTQVDALLLESGWLQSLSRGLVRGEADADDLSQDTWLAALRDPTSPPGATRAWLATVARRMAGRQRRVTTRRKDRESLVGHSPDLSYSPDETAERLELARILALELNRLPEPYRGVLFQHYYDGDAPSTIAARTNVPAGTIRWQLSHGRDLLRDALRSRDGRTWNDWAIALTPLAGAGGTTPPVIAGTSLGAVMSLKMTLAGALAGALAAGGSWWIDARPAGEAGAGVTRVARTVIHPPPAADLVATSPITASPSPTEGRTPEVATTDPLFGIVALGTIVDGMGAPVPNVAVELVDSELLAHKANSGPSGGWSCVGLEPGEYQLTLKCVAYITRDETVTISAGETWTFDTVMLKALSIPVRFETPDGEVLLVKRFSGTARFLGVAVTAERPGARMDVPGRGTSLSEGGVFQARAGGQAQADLDERYHGLLQLTVAPPQWVSLVYRDVILESRQLAGDEDELVFVVYGLKGSQGTVRVRVIDRESGEPLTGRILLGHPSGGRQTEGELEEDVLVFRDVPPGLVDLKASIKGYERLEREIMVDPGADLDLGTIAIGRTEAFTVRTVDAAGNPLQTNVSAVRPATVAGVHDLQLGISARADNDGVSTVTWLAKGPTLIRAGGRDGLARVAREIDTNEMSSIELVVPAGVEVVLVGLEPARDRAFVLENSAGAPLYSGRRPPRNPLLAPGTYVLRVLDGETERERRTFTVGHERVVVRMGGH